MNCAALHTFCITIPAVVEATPPVELIDKERAEISAKIWLFGQKVLFACVQMLGLMVFIAMHYVLDWVAMLLIGERFGLAVKFVEAMLTFAFVIVSLQLIYDMLVLFVPILRQNEMEIPDEE